MAPEYKPAVKRIDQIICANCIYSTSQDGNNYSCNNLMLNYAPTGEANITFCADGRWLLKKGSKTLVVPFDIIYIQFLPALKEIVCDQSAV